MTFANTLNRRVTITRPATGEDSAGQPMTGFVELRKAWADIRMQGGLEFIKAGAVTSTAKASVRIRYCTDVDASMRVEYGSTIYAITAVLPDTQFKRHVDLVCEVIQ